MDSNNNTELIDEKMNAEKSLLSPSDSAQNIKEKEKNNTSQITQITQQNSLSNSMETESEVKNYVNESEKVVQPRQSFIPMDSYPVTSLYDDILSYAAKNLVMGGRIAFWMPCTKE